MAELIKERPVEQVVIFRLLRCSKTHRYFARDGWTEDPNQASTFPDEIEAVRACVEHRLEDVDLVLRAPGGDTDLFSTPVR